MSENIEKNITKTRKRISSFLNKYDTKLTFGYNKNTEEPSREIGERWVDENGYEWERKDGYNSKIRKIDREEIVKTGAVGDVCSSCGKYVKKHRNDLKMYRLYGMCFDCWIPIETEMRILNTYKKFEELKIKENMKAHVRYLENEMNDYVNAVANNITDLNVINGDKSVVDMQVWSALTDEQVEEIRQKFADKIVYIRELYEKTYNEPMENIYENDNLIHENIKNIIDEAKNSLIERKKQTEKGHAKMAEGTD